MARGLQSYYYVGHSITITGVIIMESEIAELLLCSALGCTLPYALAAAAAWIKGHRHMHRNGAGAPIL
jgi:hypothetical protein